MPYQLEVTFVEIRCHHASSTEQKIVELQARPDDYLELSCQGVTAAIILEDPILPIKQGKTLAVNQKYVLPLREYPAQATVNLEGTLYEYDRGGPNQDDPMKPSTRSWPIPSEPNQCVRHSVMFSHTRNVVFQVENERVELFFEFEVTESRVRPLVDEHGRELVLHGFNASQWAKHHDGSHGPFASWEGEPDVAFQARQLGCNVVRYLIFWKGVMPEKGRVNGKATEDYFDSIQRRLNWYANHGMKVILDMHQDNWSYHCGGNGAADWASDPKPPNPPLDQLPADLDFFFKSASSCVIDSTEAFWNNDPVEDGDDKGLQDYFADAWYAVVARFKDHPAVIGYDLINEPIRFDAVVDRFIADLAMVRPNGIDSLTLFDALRAGIHLFVAGKWTESTAKVLIKLIKNTFFRSSFGNVPGVYVDNLVRRLYKRRQNDWGQLNIARAFEGTVLTNLYQKVIDRIRTVDQKNHIFFEPMSSGVNLGSRTFLGRLEDRCNDGQRRLVYAPHLYPPFSRGYYSDADRFIIRDWLQKQNTYAHENDTGLFVGEFGATSKVHSVLDTVRQFGRYRFGWTYWVSDPGSGPIAGVAGIPDYSKPPTGIERAILVLAPRAVAGRIEHYDYDAQGRQFTLTFTSNGHQPDLTARTTTISVPGRLYPDMGELEIHTDLTLSIDQERKRLIMIHDDDKPTRHTIVIRA